MKWIKKVAETPLEAIAKVIDSFSSGADKRTNAPSIRVVEDAINDKASTGDLMTLEESVTEALETKATKADVQAVESALEDKASTEDITQAVQGIEEDINEMRTDLEGQIVRKANRAEMFITRDYNYSYEIAAGAYAQITAANLNISAISGYTPIGFKKINAGSRHMNVSLMQAVTSGTVIGMSNTNTASISNTISLTILYVRDDVTEG